MGRRREELDRRNARRQKAFRRAGALVSAMEILRILAEHPEGAPLLKEDIFKRVEEAGSEFLQMLHRKMANEQENVK